MAKPRTSYQIGIVGAGPAGVAAAVAAANVGASVVLLGENKLPGGQAFRQRPKSLAPSTKQSIADPLEGQKRKHLQELADSSADVVSGTLVWDAIPGPPHQVVTESRVFEVEKLVIATGAHEVVVPFPGWDLPGVMTAGAGLNMVKEQNVRPGDRVLIAGTGRLLIAAAASLAQAGCQVVAALDAYRGQRWWTALGPGAANWDKIRQALTYARVLVKHRVPFKLGYTVLQALGSDVVDRAVVAPVNGSGSPNKQAAREVSVDTVCVSFGLRPSTHLAQIMDLQMHHDRLRGGWIPDHNQHMETSAPGVFVAGEAAGIGGVDVALLQGQIAGLRAAGQLGLMDAQSYDRRVGSIRGRLSRALRFTAFLNTAYAVRPGLYELTTDETVLCRCEEVIAGDLRNLLPFGTDLRSIKMASRIGMGLCQGRMCEPGLATLIDRLGERPPTGQDRLRGRHPVRPVPLHAFLDD